MRPTLPAMLSAHHRLPSGPAAIALGFALTGYSVTAPAVVMRPILAAFSLNHRFPSGPRVMWSGVMLGSEYSATEPAGAMRPMTPLGLPPLTAAVYHTLPSGPAVMPYRDRLAVFGANSVVLPAWSMRPILPPMANSVNQTFPSGPAAMSFG